MLNLIYHFPRKACGYPLPSVITYFIPLAKGVYYLMELKKKKKG